MHPKLLANFVYRLDATDRFKCDLGLELARKNLALRFIHNLLLVTAGYHLKLLSENRGPYMDAHFCQAFNR